MMVDYCTIPVEELLPHSGDMVLLDKIIEYGENFAVSQIAVTTESRFYTAEYDGVHSSIGLEWMAQTIAAMAGIQALQNDKPVQIGFLLGTRRYIPVKTVFEAYSEYRIKVKRLYHEPNGLGAFQCRIDQGEDLIVEAKLNVFAPNNAEEFLKGEGI